MHMNIYKEPKEYITYWRRFHKYCQFILPNGIKCNWDFYTLALRLGLLDSE